MSDDFSRGWDRYSDERDLGACEESQARGEVFPTHLLPPLAADFRGDPCPTCNGLGLVQHPTTELCPKHGEYQPTDWRDLSCRECWLEELDYYRLPAPWPRY